MLNAAVPVRDIATLATGSAASINAQVQSRDNSCLYLSLFREDAEKLHIDYPSGLTTPWKYKKDLCYISHVKQLAT